MSAAPAGSALPVALTVAGSDPSGGAGVQADLRAFAALGVAGVSVITALTAQNSQGVRAVFPVPSEQLAAQLETLFTDVSVDAVKIGMLGGAAQVEVVADALRRHCPPNVVLDPLLASTGGVPLLDAEGRAALVERLLPLCDLVTPNVEEAGELTGVAVSDTRSALAAARRLLKLGVRAVLVKGGHLPGAPVDLLLTDAASPVFFPGERISTPHTHGTGCLLSAGIAAHLARSHLRAGSAALPEAIRAAKALVADGLRHPVRVGQGRGYPAAPRGESRSAPAVMDASLPDAGRQVRGVYVIANAGLRPDRSPEAITAAALAGGARLIQLRDKNGQAPALVATAKRLRRLTRAAGALLIVNDRVDVALAADADGVHLGPEDLPPEDARRLLGPDRLIGVSVSTVAEAHAAAPFASYFGVGSIYATRTKSDAGEPVGPSRITEIRRAFPSHRIVAVGGISAATLPEVFSAGADAAAVVSAVVAAPDMEAATRELVTLAARLGRDPG